MERVYHNVKITHGFADGRVMTNDEFMSKPLVVEYENNKEIYEEADRLYNPFYERKMKQIQHREYTARRKAELTKKIAEIENELTNL